MERLGSITEDAAISLLRLNVEEHAYNMRIGRNLNFRFDDGSSISNSPESEVYRRRSLSPISKKIAEEMKAEDRNYPFMLHESLSHVKIFFKAFPAMRWINLTRHPVDVIHSWYLRGWGHRLASDPLAFSPVVQGKKVTVPWYAVEWREEYSRMSEMDKIIKSVCTLVEMGDETYSSLTDEERKRILIVRYEDLVERTFKEIEKIGFFLSTIPLKGMAGVLVKERCPGKISLDKRREKEQNIKTMASKKMFNHMAHFVSLYEEKNR